jgi:hypothetical protein
MFLLERKFVLKMNYITIKTKKHWPGWELVQSVSSPYTKAGERVQDKSQEQADRTKQLALPMLPGRWRLSHSVMSRRIDT